MAASIKALGIDRLRVEERLTLVDEIWDSIAADSMAVPLPVEQAQELERRLAAHEATPDDVVYLADVRASISKLLGRWRWLLSSGAQRTGSSRRRRYGTKLSAPVWAGSLK
jgi:putative addiction module component (TIGR02574 family)